MKSKKLKNALVVLYFVLMILAQNGIGKSYIAIVSTAFIILLLVVFRVKAKLNKLTKIYAGFLVIGCFTSIIFITTSHPENIEYLYQNFFSYMVLCFYASFLFGQSCKIEKLVRWFKKSTWIFGLRNRR